MTLRHRDKRLDADLARREPDKAASFAAADSTALAPLADGVYLIGCGCDASTTNPVPNNTHNTAPASPQSMGFKAWNLLRMAQMSLPVPPAFVLGTHYYNDPEARQLASDPTLWRPALQRVERTTGRVFGDNRNPLLLSVRSGAPISMPGMMVSLLNIGLCDATLPGVVRQTGNPRLVWDAYRRLIATYAEDVAGLPARRFAEATAALVGAGDERALDFTELRALTRQFLAIYASLAGQPFPQEPGVQLAGAINAVLASWQSSKAQAYRRLNNLPDTIGTAVTVQAMVFGNAGGKSGAGVGFTRNPATGDPALWVDFLFNAQGEDVVSGRRNANDHSHLVIVLPAVWQALQDTATQLEQHFKDMQDFEFTVQEGQLFMLQTRDGKRTPRAAARIALDMLEEGLISAELAAERTVGLDRDQLAQVRVVAESGSALTPLARAATASSGVAIGEIALDEARAVARHNAGKPVILVRRDAETADLTALEAAAGLLTQRGARTAHAAVVARQLGKVCLIGCADLHIDEAARCIQVGDTTLQEGDLLTLDGNEGVVFAGAARTEIDYPHALLARLARLRQQQMDHPPPQTPEIS